MTEGIPEPGTTPVTDGHADPLGVGPEAQLHAVQELPSRPLTRSRPLAEMPSTLEAANLSELAAQRIAGGHELSDTLRRLAQEKWFNPVDRAVLVGQRMVIDGGVKRLETAVRQLPVGGAAAQADANGFVVAYHNVMAKSEALVRSSEIIAQQAKTTIEHRAIKAVVAKEESKYKSALEKFTMVASGALNTGAGVLIPTGMSWASGLVNVGTTAATQASMHAFTQWQRRHYSEGHTATEAIHQHAANSFLMAERNLASAKEGFELFMAAAAVGGGYVPGWAIISAVLTKVGNAYLDGGLKLAKEYKNNPGQAPKELSERMLNWQLLEDVWKGVRDEIQAKATDLPSLFTVYKAATGDPDAIELAAIGASVATAGIAEVLKALIPPHPAKEVTETDLLDTIRTLAGAHVTDGQQPVPTISRVNSIHSLPEGIPDQTTYGHKVLAHDAGRSDATGDYVQIAYHGTKVWGRISDKGVFKPDKLDEGSFVLQHIWKNRTIGQNHYSYKVRGTDGQEREVTVKGTWSQPFEGSYVKVFRTEDGHLEPAHAMAPTSMDSDEYNVHKTIQQAWLKPFVWEAPDVLAVDHAQQEHVLSKDGTPPAHDLWAMQQKASWIARRAVSLSLSTGQVADLLTVKVEGGGHGHNALRRGLEHLVGLDDNAKAQVTGQLRAADVKTRMVELVALELGKLGERYSIAPDRMPTAASLFGEPTSRGTALTSEATGHETLTEDQMRQTFVWVEEHVAVSPGAFMPGPDEFAEPAWLAYVRAGLVPVDEDTPNLAVFSTRDGKLPAGLVDAVKERPHRQFIVLDREKSGALPKAEVNRLTSILEAFRAGQRALTVIVRGTLGPEIRPVLENFGGGVVLDVITPLGNGFAAVSPAEGFSYDPDAVSTTIDGRLLDEAAKTKSTPPADVADVDETLGGWYFGLDSIEDRYGAMQAEWQRFSQRAVREQTASMIARAPNDPALAVLEPLLTFGPTNNIVPTALTVEAAKMPATIAKEFVKQLADGQADAAAFASIAKVATLGADDETRHGYGPFVTGLMLESIAKAQAHEFADANRIVQQMKAKGKLTAEQATAWTDAVDAVEETMSGGKEQLAAMRALILEC
jgi:hypothetical protein